MIEAIDMVNGNERIAFLEAKQQNDAQTMHEIKETLHSLDEKVGHIELRLEKSMSFIGGISFVFSMLGGVLALVLNYLIRKM